MIDALFWYAGHIAWVLIVFACPRARAERYVLRSGCTSGPRPARGVRQSGIQGGFLTLRRGRIDQRHILEVLDRERFYAGGGVELL